MQKICWEKSEFKPDADLHPNHSHHRPEHIAAAFSNGGQRPTAETCNSSWTSKPGGVGKRYKESHSE